MATIKVGDKVRLLDNSYYSKDNDDDLRPGVEGIVAYSDDFYLHVDIDGYSSSLQDDSWPFYEDELELA